MSPDEIHNRLFILADKLSDVINPVLLAFIAEEPLRLRELRRASAEKMARLWPDTWRLWAEACSASGERLGLPSWEKRCRCGPVTQTSRRGTPRLRPQRRRLLCCTEAAHGFG